MTGLVVRRGGRNGRYDRFSPGGPEATTMIYWSLLEAIVPRQVSPPRPAPSLFVLREQVGDTPQLDLAAGLSVPPSPCADGQDLAVSGREGNTADETFPRLPPRYRFCLPGMSIPQDDLNDLLALVLPDTSRSHELAVGRAANRSNLPI